MIKEPKTATSIKLKESRYSDAVVIKNLLDLIYTSEPAKYENIELAYQVITLATDWGCDAVLNVFKKDLAIEALVYSIHGPSNSHLRLAHKLGDHHLMALIAQRGRKPGLELRSVRYFQAVRDPTGVRKLYDKPAVGLAGSSTTAGIATPVYELGGLSYSEFLKVPPTVLWALARSTYLARKDQGEVDIYKMAECFESLLNLACKSTKSLALSIC